MDYLTFKQKFFELGCFNNNQVFAWYPAFDRNNLGRWTKKGLLLRLKRGYYTFPEYKARSGYAYFFANCMYRPSYISLHAALSFYGIIPESVVQITSVTSLKTALFVNNIGQFTYKSVKPALMFGYDPRLIADERSVNFAQPEKALLDLLYLYPEYKTEKHMSDLRFDEDFLHDEMNMGRLEQDVAKFENSALEQRFRTFCKVYEL